MNQINDQKLEIKFINNSEFEQWDKAFVQSHPDAKEIIASDYNSNDELLQSTLDDIIRNELEELDAMFEKKYPS